MHEKECLGLSAGRRPPWVMLLPCVLPQTLANCGDAIRFRHPGSSNQLLDNTVWFDKIINSQVGKRPQGTGSLVL